MKKTVIYILFFTTLSFSQNQFKKGVIIDSIPVSDIKGETFALYLPNSFDPQNISPIVFVYDPSAKGKSGIKPFIKASEKYNFIIACSNNSKNGSNEKNFKISNNLFSYVFSIFKIKKDEAYLSGFSGGSRLASSIASITNQFAGVIACGAGFSGVPQYLPASQNYSYVGICGNRDMNYREMLKNKTILNMKNFNNTLITYKGKHSWPDENEILRAFDWLYLQKSKKDNALINKKNILELYERDYNIIVEHKKNDEFIFAAENYQRLIESYSPFLKLDSLKIKFEKLKKSKNYQKQVKSLSNVLKTETEISDKLIKQFYLDLKNTNNDNLDWWNEQLKKLKKIENSNDIDIKNMVYRIKFSLYAAGYAAKKFYLKDNNHLKRDFINKLIKLIRPELSI